MSQWTIDVAHSEVTFKVKHLMISTVKGRFTKFSGTVSASKPDFSDARVEFSADVNSINTNNEQRDGHLKSPDFFDAANHPTLTFSSTAIKTKSEGEYEMHGLMNIRGTSKEITLRVVYNGTAKGFEGDVAGFEITGALNRQDFGLRWNALTEAGGVVVSDEVKLDIVAELKKTEVEKPVTA